MAYCTSTEVINEFKKLDVTGSIITTAKITAWIAESDAYIDGRVGNIYETPVTGTNSLLVLKTISIGLVAQRIAYIMEVKSITPKGDQYVPKNLIVEAEKKLAMISKRELTLSDATASTTNVGVQSYSSENTVSRTMDQTKDQW